MYPHSILLYSVDIKNKSHVKHKQSSSESSRPDPLAAMAGA